MQMQELQQLRLLQQQREMAFCVFEKDRKTLKYRCPAAVYGLNCEGFAGRHNIRELNKAGQMAAIVVGFVGRRLMDRDLAGGIDGRLN